MRKRVETWVGRNQERFDSLMELFFSREKVLEQRAGWPMAVCVELNPQLAEPWIDRMLENLKRPKLHPAVIRNTYRTFQFIEILPQYEEAIFSACMAALGGPMEVAVKAAAITVLRRLVDRFPELRPEIICLIEEQLPTQSPAFLVRARKEFGLRKGDHFREPLED